VGCRGDGGKVTKGVARRAGEMTFRRGIRLRVGFTHIIIAAPVARLNRGRQSMAVAKLIVIYPMPKDMAAFERAYSAEHIPMAARIFKAAGATKAVLTKMLGAPSGTPAFHRMAEIHFPSA